MVWMVGWLVGWLVLFAGLRVILVWLLVSEENNDGAGRGVGGHKNGSIMENRLFLPDRSSPFCTARWNRPKS